MTGFVVQGHIIYPKYAGCYTAKSSLIPKG